MRLVTHHFSGDNTPPMRILPANLLRLQLSLNMFGPVSIGGPDLTPDNGFQAPIESPIIGYTGELWAIFGPNAAIQTLEIMTL